MDESQNFPKNPFKPNEEDDGQDITDGPNIALHDLFSLVRHSKLAQIKAAIDYLPNKAFDKALVQVRVYWSFLMISLVFSCFLYITFEERGILLLKTFSIHREQIYSPLRTTLLDLSRPRMSTTTAPCMYKGTSGCRSI